MSATDPTFTEWDFIADMLYQQDAIDEGYAAGVRWWCLRWEERQKWRYKALKRIREWRAVEKGCQDRRDSDISFRTAQK